MTTRACVARRAVVAVLLLAAGLSGARAASTAAGCRRQCSAGRRACLAVARHAGAGDCTGTAKACRRTAHARVRAARKSCAQLRRDCRACCKAGGSGPRCPVGKSVPFDPPPPQNLVELGVPRLADGTFFLIAVPDAQLAIDPTLRTPVTVLGDCTNWITTCVDQATRSLDDCARSAPPCGTDHPAGEPTCCPAACFEQYQTRRRSGDQPLAAFGAVYFDDASCFPGVRALLDGGAP
jgi:hypothetical protein